MSAPRPPWPYRVAAAKGTAEDTGNYDRFMQVMEQSYNDTLRDLGRAERLVRAALGAVTSGTEIPRDGLVALLRLACRCDRAGFGFDEPVSLDDLEWVTELLGGPVDGPDGSS